MDVEQLKQRVCGEVDRRRDALLHVSHEVFEHPELCFEERFAHDLLTTAIEREGLPVERRLLGLDTAFRAAAGSHGPSVAVLCEYDALPGMGHACGHNVIAAAGLGAGLALAAVADEARGRVVILGTPAEEGGGGKVLLVERGALAGVDAAMMVHPADADLLRMDTLAIEQLEARYEGRAAHAAATPWEGRNALDACVLGYVNVAALRQHIAPDERVHGVITHGGDKPNVVPASASSSWYVRSPSREARALLRARVVAALEAGAAAAGCSVTIERVGEPYAEVADNPRLVEAFAANAARVGRRLADPREGRRVLASTDMGDVSQVVPAIHPMLQVAPEGVPIHTPAFAAHARGEEGDRAVLDGAKAMAMTAIDLWCDPATLAEVRASFGRSPEPPAG